MFSRVNIPPEGAALLALVRASLSDAPCPAENFPSSLDWNFLLRLARHHRLEPLLSYGLRRSHVAGIPSRVRAEWDARRRHAVARALYHQKAIAAIATIFEARGVPYVLLKGEALSKAFYPQDGLRPYGDIDLLIRPEDYEPAKAALKELGFQLRRATKEFEERRFFGEIEFDTEGPRSLTVDLHWDTMMTCWEPHSLFKEDGTWASPDHIRLGDRAIPVLNRELHLLFLSVHLAFHHVFDGLLLLCDLLLVLRRDAERIDWDRLIEVANQCRCRRALFFSLYFANWLLAAPVPSEILDRLRPSGSILALMPTGRLLFRDTLVPKMLEGFVRFLMIDAGEGRRRAFQTWLEVTLRGV
jgi:hypothetical protein